MKKLLFAMLIMLAPIAHADGNCIVQVRFASGIQGLVNIRNVTSISLLGTTIIFRYISGPNDSAIYTDEAVARDAYLSIIGQIQKCK